MKTIVTYFALALTALAHSSELDYTNLITQFTKDEKRFRYTTFPPSKGLIESAISEMKTNKKVLEAMISLGDRFSKESVTVLKEEKAIWSLQLLLCRPGDLNDQRRVTALKALSDIGDERAVPFILSLAESLSYAVGGSESATEHGIIITVFANTLSSLTGIKNEMIMARQDLDGYDEHLRKCRRWLENKTNKDANQAAHATAASRRVWL